MVQSRCIGLAALGLVGLMIASSSPARDLGVDVSHFQGATGISQSSWGQMAADGKAFTFIKATEGLTGPDDAAMLNNANRASAAGILNGVYHFAHAENRPTTAGAVLEADHLVTYAGSLIGPGHLRPVLDLESANSSLSTSGLTDWVIAFVNEVKLQRGNAAEPIIYTTGSFLTTELDSRVANYDLWVRDVSSADPQTANPATGLFNNWSFLQYSDSGSSGGISPLDLDVVHSEYKPLSAFIIPEPGLCLIAMTSLVFLRTRKPKRAGAAG